MRLHFFLHAPVSLFSCWIWSGQWTRGVAMAAAVKALGTEQQLLFQLARHPEAQAVGRRWIELAAKTGDRRHLAEAEYRTGISVLSHQRSEEATAYLRRALEYSESFSDENFRLTVLIDLARARINLADYAEGDKLLDRADVLWAKTRDARMRARISMPRGWSLHARGKSLDALPFFERP